jgi:hypothetical protein
MKATAMPDEFKLAFESYCRNLNIVIDLSHKCIGLVLAFLVIFFSLHKTDECHNNIKI